MIRPTKSAAAPDRASKLGFLSREPLYHYALDRFSLKSPILYRPDHQVVHIGGGPNRNHPRELNLNCCKMANVDIVGDAERLPLADETVDVIISSAVLEHVHDFSAAVREMHRVLKPGGLIYIEIPFLQAYHTHDVYGVQFEDYRRLSRVGLIDAFEFCTPLDVGVCVGPTSALLQIMYAFARDLGTSRLYRRAVQNCYYVLGNLIVWVDAWLPERTIRQSSIPSGVYFFGRKRDAHSPWLESQRGPTSIFPQDLQHEIALVSRSERAVELRVTNNSHTKWLHASPLSWGTVNVGLQRVAPQTQVDYRRLAIPHDVAPGESFSLRLERDEFADADRMRVDLVAEGVSWFAERGSKPLDVSWK